MADQSLIGIFYLWVAWFFSILFPAIIRIDNFPFSWISVIIQTRQQTTAMPKKESRPLSHGPVFVWAGYESMRLQRPDTLMVSGTVQHILI